MAVVLWALLLLVGGAYSDSMKVTLRTMQDLPGDRRDWQPVNTDVTLDPSKTALIVFDMFADFWCPTLAHRIEAIAGEVNLVAASLRKRNAAIIWAPNGVSGYYDSNPARKHTLSLPKANIPSLKNVTIPTLPLHSDCDVWNKTFVHPQKQTDSLVINATDYIVGNLQELWNVLHQQGATTIFYAGMGSNTDFVQRSFFSLQQLHQLAFEQSNLVLLRELHDVLSSPDQPPYLNRPEALRVHTEYLERFLASTASIEDLM